MSFSLMQPIDASSPDANLISFDLIWPTEELDRLLRDDSSSEEDVIVH